MKIIQANVSNYRNIDGISVDFNSESSYIIGENNLGKSNFLTLLGTVCNGKGFDDNDFLDSTKPIEVELVIKLLPNEQGFFGDNFSPDDASLLKIRYRQSIEEAYPTIVSIDTNENIAPRLIRKIHFLRYDTTSVPSKELRIDTQKGAGLLISDIIQRFIVSSTEPPAFLNDDQIEKLTEFINKHLDKIQSFHNYSIKATIASNPSDMLTSLFYLSDGERKIDTTGSGVQFLAMASINIVCQIMELYKSKSAPFSNQVYIDKDGKQILPLILAIDEPEVHLHPYLQRSLISYYKRILHNEDTEFAELLKACFGIDGIDGQLIIVTHSTDVLIDDYRNLIRFYRVNGKTSVVSGHSLKITGVNEKHLIMHFPEIKEAFYAHCAILIEGETEYGCISSFAKKIDIPLDDYGICVINAQGQGTIKPLQQLLKIFGVLSIAIYDGDVKVGQTPNDDEFFTKELCFEIEIVTKLFDAGQATLIRKIALELDSNAEKVPLNIDFVHKYFKKMGVDTNSYVPKKLSEISNDSREEFIRMYSTWFMVKKGVLLGRIIGELIPDTLIPSCYSDAIRRAKEVASNA